VALSSRYRYCDFMRRLWGDCAKCRSRQTQSGRGRVKIIFPHTWITSARTPALVVGFFMRGRIGGMIRPRFNTRVLLLSMVLCAVFFAGERC